MRAPITTHQVVQAAIAVLNEVGLDGLTMRGVAKALSVQHNTVQWHAQSKARLLELIADEMLAGIDAEPLPDEWAARVKELYRRCRRTWLSHRDGARVMAGVNVPAPNTLHFAEQVMSTLLGAGFPPDLASQLHWLVFYFTLGIVQEEQAGGRDGELSESALTDDYPSLRRARVFLGAENFDERFELGLDMLIEAATGRLALASAG